jgi:hypothetical protein
MFALALPSACSTLLAIGGAESFKFEVPGQAVTVSIEIPGLKRDKNGEIPGRTLIAGELPDGTVFSLLWEQNFPFVAAANCPDVFSGEQGFHAFKVGDKTCCQFRMVIHNALVQSQYYAFLTTPDFQFTIHASRSSALKSGTDTKEVKQSEMEPIVKSLSVSGEADRTKYSYPPEVYAFRDEAAKVVQGQMDWVEMQCSARAEDWVPAFYLGELADNSHKVDLALRGFQRASEILAKRTERSPKETRALIVSLDRRGACLATQKKFDQAIPVCQQILDATQPDSAKEFKAFREEALFNLACCNAMTTKPDQALKYLRQAIEARPEFKKRAAQEDWLSSLRNKAEFKKLVGP